MQHEYMQLHMQVASTNVCYGQEGDLTPTEPDGSEDAGSSDGSESGSEAEGSGGKEVAKQMSGSDPVWLKHAAQVRRLCNPTSKRPKIRVSEELARRFLHGTKHERDLLIKMMMDLQGKKDGFIVLQ